MSDEKTIKDEELSEDEVTEEAKEVQDEEAGSEEGAKESTSDEKEEDNKEDKKNGKKKNKGYKNDAMKEKVEELEDKVKRQLAEFENFRNRTEKEKSQMFEIGAKSIIEKILPAIDSFERGLATIGEADKGSPLAEGMEKIYKQLIGSLEEAGLKHIEAVGQEFDPNLHNAVMHEDNDELGENVVSEEFQKGYMYRDSIVRHSMVKVAN